MDTTYTAFDGPQLCCHGSLLEVVREVKKKIGKAANSKILIFSDATGKTMDFNFQGSEKDVLQRLEIFVSAKEEPSQGPGRPKLGVVSREVSLLPRHWEWLATQQGGASACLRRLVEDAKKKPSANLAKQAQERAHAFLSALAGDWAGYEEALRALYQKDKKKFLAETAKWPKDVRMHVLALSEDVF